VTFFFYPFISFFYPDKTAMFIVIGISDSNLFSFDLCTFIIFFDKILFFFQFNIWFLICIYNIFRFGHSTFNFLFFLLLFCQSFYDFQFYLSNQIYDFYFFNDNNDINFIHFLLISYCFLWLFYQFFFYSFQFYHSNH